MTPEQNFDFFVSQLKRFTISSDTLVCLPETWLGFFKHSKAALAFSKESDYWLEQLSQLCRLHSVWLNAGTLALPALNGRFFAASVLFNSKGEIVAQYNKIHLFDAKIADGTGLYQESKLTQAGSEVCVVDSPFGRIGLSVCYDLRFAGLYQAMVAQKVQTILVPSAFTQVTGKAHWHALLKARAIETQSFVIASAQSGQHENGRETYGHSLMVSPYGEVLLDAKQQLGGWCMTLDLAQCEAVRDTMPIATHNRFKSEFI